MCERETRRNVIYRNHKREKERVRHGERDREINDLEVVGASCRPPGPEFI